MKYLVAMMLLASVVNAATITVDINGTGDHATIAAGVGAAGAGDTVVVKDGTYAESVTITTSGTAGNPLVFRAENRHGATVRKFDVNADFVTIDGFDFSGTGAVGIDAAGKNYLRAVNNRFISPGGRYAVYAGSHAYVADNFMQNVDSGVLLNSHSVAENNRIINIVGGRPNIFFFFEGDTIVIRNNYMWNDDPSLEGSHFFTTWDVNGTSSSDIVMENNVGFNVMHALESEGRTLNESGRWTFRNNLFMNTYYVGLSPRGTGDLTIVNNTFINCGSYPVWPVDCPGVHIIKNNVFAYLGTPDIPNSIDKAIRVDNSGTPQKSNNFSWRYSMYEPGPDGGVFMPALCWVNPDPFDTAAFDFNLKEGATLIDAGCDVGLNYDLVGNARPNGSSVDPGAYEYPGAATVTEPSIMTSEPGNGISISPCPTRGRTVIAGNAPLGSVTVINAAGTEVWQGSTGGTELVLNLQECGLQPGRFYVRSSGSNAVSSFIFMK